MPQLNLAALFGGTIQPCELPPKRGPGGPKVRKEEELPDPLLEQLLSLPYDHQAYDEGVPVPRGPLRKGDEAVAGETGLCLMHHGVSLGWATWDPGIRA